VSARRGALAFLRLLDHPRDVPLSPPLIEREILWRLLAVKQGAMLWQIGLADSRLSQLSHAIKWIRANYAQILRIEDLAQMAARRASPRSNRHFRGDRVFMSPIQYQSKSGYGVARRRGSSRKSADGGLRSALRSVTIAHRSSAVSTVACTARRRTRRGSLAKRPDASNLARDREASFGSSYVAHGVPLLAFDHRYKPAKGIRYYKESGLFPAQASSVLLMIHSRAANPAKPDWRQRDLRVSICFQDGHRSTREGRSRNRLRPRAAATGQLALPFASTQCPLRIWLGSFGDATFLARSSQLNVGVDFNILVVYFSINVVKSGLSRSKSLSRRRKRLFCCFQCSTVPADRDIDC